MGTGRDSPPTKPPDEVERARDPFASFRFRACGRKRGYADDRSAKQAAGDLEAKYGEKMHIYRCQFCRLRHLTSKAFTPGQRDGFRRTARQKAKQG